MTITAGYKAAPEFTRFAPTSGRARDLAMFNKAIDSKLRGRDVVVIRVEDVGASG